MFCCQSAAILGHLPYLIGNFHPLFTKHVVGSVEDVGLLPLSVFFRTGLQTVGAYFLNIFEGV